MSIADRIYLMRDGQVEQKGRPKDIYENPRTRYAAEFLGRANIIARFERTSDAGAASIRLGALALPAPAGMPDGASLCVRPEKWRVVAADAPDALAGRIVETRYAGDRVEFVAETAVGRVSVVEVSREDRRPGDAVGLTLDARDVKWVA